MGDNEELFGGSSMNNKSEIEKLYNNILIEYKRMKSIWFHPLLIYKNTIYKYNIILLKIENTSARIILIKRREDEWMKF